MSQLVILCIEDEPEVRQAIARDLEVFEPAFLVELTEDVADARDVFSSIVARGDEVALILADHLLPGTQGTDYLIQLHADTATHTVRKVLLTGQADHDDTIRAINEAGLDHYLAKPWTREELHQVVREQLTDYVLDNVADVLPYVSTLDGPRLLQRIADTGWDE